MKNCNLTTNLTTTCPKPDQTSFGAEGYITPYKGVYISPSGQVGGQVRSKGQVCISPYSFAGIKHQQQTACNIEQIVDIVAEIFGIHPNDIITRNRRWNVCEARYAAIVAIGQKMLKLTDTKISGYFGLERTACSHARNQVANLCQIDKQYADKISLIKKRLQHA